MAMHFREPNEVRWVGTRPAHKGTQILVETHVDDGVAIVRTVPGGKVLYLCECSLFTCSQVSGLMSLTLRNTSDVTVRDFCYINVQANTTIVRDCNHFWPPLEIPPGYDIVVVSNTAGLVAYGGISGWEE